MTRSAPVIARLFLLADSAPLFDDGFIAKLGDCSGMPGIYIGAANGDLADYFDLAEAFFMRLGASPRWHLQAKTENRLANHDRASVIILAGGDVDQGWRYLNQPVIRNWLEAQRQLGSVFLGISAGAIHFGHGLDRAGMLQPYLDWLPDGVAVHEESLGWPSRAAMLNQQCPRVWCIPHGDAVVISQGGAASFKGTAIISTASDNRDALSWQA
ncbi:MAG: hypothetical protein WD397_12600 [Wenzhouxiangellaceae bacterium]